MSIKKKSLIVAATAASYFLLFELNEYLFSSFGYSEGVTWIFLPSGLRLVFILLFAEWGAIGIALASITTGYLFQFEGNLLTALGAGFISGFAPWLAWRISIDRFDLDVNLNKLTATTLIRVSVMFAVLSPVLHQVWYSFRGQTENFIRSTAVMAAGDLIGTLVVLYTAKWAVTRFTATVNRETS